ncbi:MAG: hypothetical protein Q9183_005383 [Haloplaca sp. 2 TL-2023]
MATREENRREDEEDMDDDDDESSDSEENVNGSENYKDGKTQPHPTSQQSERQRDKGRNAWYSPAVPPFALWVCGSDALVDGRRLLRRFAKGREPHVRVVHQKVIEEYEHLDVIWAMDMIEKVGKEVKEVLWKTVEKETREGCVVPRGCEEVGYWEGKIGAAEESVSHGS